MKSNKPFHIKTITEFHRFRELPKPEHPLISIVDFSTAQDPPEEMNGQTWIQDFYCIAIKHGIKGKLKYGQQKYDFDEGVMSFSAPGQLFGFDADSIAFKPTSGWMLLIHPDFLWNTSLGKNIKNYEYFSYSIHEALFLSGKEETVINNIIENIRQEYHSNIDKFSPGIIISQIETLLNYADRYYQRQFLTRKITNHQILDQLERILAEYFNSDDLIIKGLPTVHYIADSLNLSSGYLSNLLKALTGQSTQQHIHDKLIEKAKEKLSTTSLSVSEIAYSRGFEHSQSFSKLFKSKTRQSPLEFRTSFN